MLIGTRHEATLRPLTRGTGAKAKAKAKAKAVTALRAASYFLLLVQEKVTKEKVTKE